VGDERMGENGQIGERCPWHGSNMREVIRPQ
jgi:hypothetical protein